MGKLFLQTQTPTGSKFCMYNYFVMLSMGKQGSQNQARGKFTIQLETAAGKGPIDILDNDDTIFKKNSKEYKLISQTHPFVGTFTNLFISYTKTTTFLTSLFYDNQWNFDLVEVIDGETQEKTGWKQTETWIVSGQNMQFYRKSK